MNTEGKALQYSLRVYKEMREKILEDTKNKDADLYLGLHDKNSIRNRYIERYEIIWMLDHMKCFQQIMDKNVPNRQKLYRDVFIKNYSKFLMENEKFCYDISSTTEILENERGMLEQMIDTSISWEQGYKDMLLLKKKFDEKFKRIMEEELV